MIAALVVGLVLAADSGPAVGHPADPGPGAPAGGGDSSLAAVASPASAPQDTLVRIPGCALRLGWDHARTSALGSFPLGATSGAAETREGELRWFGYPAKVGLTYRAEQLSEVRLASNSASPRFADYVPDELRRLGYRRTAQEGSLRNGTSQWEGEASVRLTISSGSVVAEFSAREPSEPVVVAPAASSPPEVAGANPPAGAPGTPSAPDTLLVDFTTIAPESLDAPRPLAPPPLPARPKVAVEAGVFGRVLLRVTVGTAGTVEDARIERGIPELNHAALAWAGALRFEPLLREGRAVRFALLVPVAFLPTRSGTEGGKP